MKDSKANDDVKQTLYQRFWKEINNFRYRKGSLSLLNISAILIHVLIKKGTEIQDLASHKHAL